MHPRYAAVLVSGLCFAALVAGLSLAARVRPKAAEDVLLEEFKLASSCVEELLSFEQASRLGHTESMKVSATAATGLRCSSVLPLDIVNQPDLLELYHEALYFMKYGRTMPRPSKSPAVWALLFSIISFWTCRFRSC